MPLVIASHEHHPSATTWFNVGAGQGQDGVLFDNKLAQTFVPAESGRLESVSIAAHRMTDTTAPLRIRIADTLDGTPTSTLAETFIRPDEVRTSLTGCPVLNATGVFASATLTLAAGKQYALVFDSAEPEANYRIYGCYEHSYTNGIRFKSQNSTTWKKERSGDYFFQVHAWPSSKARSTR